MIAVSHGHSTVVMHDVGLAVNKHYVTLTCELTGLTVHEHFKNGNVAKALAQAMSELKHKISDHEDKSQ